MLEAMGFPSDWCERALRSSGGVEPAVELLLQWQANGGAPPLPPPESAAVSSVTNAASLGLDAVVPDAGGAPDRTRRLNPDLRLKKVLRSNKKIDPLHAVHDTLLLILPICRWRCWL